MEDYCIAVNILPVTSLCCLLAIGVNTTGIIRKYGGGGDVIESEKYQIL
jgi:hypothetical protein